MEGPVLVYVLKSLTMWLCNKMVSLILCSILVYEFSL